MNSTEAHFIQLDIHNWIEQQGGIVNRPTSGIQLEGGQIVIVIDSIIGERKISIRKLLDDYPDRVIERIKEIITHALNS